MVEFRLSKESAMQIPVAIEPTGSGGFRAQSVPPFTSVAEGQTSDEAISKVRAELNKEVAAGKRLVLVDVAANEDNPWLAMAGWLKDDPMFDEWQAAIRENRRQRDIEDGIVARERQ
jgi:hypothetical protein